MRKINFIILLIIILISTEFIFGQTLNCNKSNLTEYYLGANLGLNDFHSRDEYLSPNNYSGLIFSADILFHAKVKNILHEAEIYFSTGNPATTAQSTEIKQKIGSISYSFLYNFDQEKIYRSPLDVYLGAGVSSFVMNTDYFLNSDYGLGQYTDQSWYWSHSINLLLAGVYSINEKNSLTMHLSIPLVSLISRPSNGHWMDQKNLNIINNSFFNAAKGGNLEFFTDNFVIQGLIQFSQKVSDKLSFNGTYRFNFVSSNEPLAMRTYMNTFMAGIEFAL